MRPGVLLIRPDQHADPLELGIRDHGFPVFRHAVVAIESVNLAAEQLQAISTKNWDGIVVISPNAAREFNRQLEQAQLEWPQAKHYLTVGPGTAEVLSPFCQQPVTWPAQAFNSEALLEFPELASLAGENWLIITGENGRELLPDSLKKRGATVEVCACYRRQPTTTDVVANEPEWQQQVAVVLVSSLEQAQLFHGALSAEGKDWVNQTHWIAPSGRILDGIAELGVAPDCLHAAPSAMPSALIKTLLSLPLESWQSKTKETTRENAVNAPHSSTSAPQQETSEQVKSKDKRGGGRFFSGLLMVLVIASLAVLATGGWWVWQQQQALNAATNAEIASVTQRLEQAEQVTTSSAPAVDTATIEAEVERLRAVVDDRLASERAARERGLERLAAAQEDAAASLQQGQSQMARQLTRMSEQLRTSEARQGSHWHLLEAYDLVGAAMHRLNFEYQRDMAIQLLAQAEELLSTANADAYQLVIRQLRNDQEMLAELPEVDTQSIVLRLHRLQRSVRDLPLQHTLIDEEATDSTDRSDISNWRRNLAAAWQSFTTDLVKVQRHDGLPMRLDSDQRALLFGRMELQLQIAQQAALNHHQDYYQATLRELLGYIDDYFIAEQRSVEQVRAEIESLLAMNVEPDYPSRLLSHAMLRDLVDELREPRPINGGQ
ncbi:MAG: uroporphyrinogen-III synthase [Aliidiomarina sp.]|uniref:uroporphyrinogen-III C-methyltransferase n=1 Tax=Aliidiomarina sp. TaxID=1872439 RepID=UPI0025C3D3F0|nr:uroporphyrinogen-III C-methyltransferase [Aliidiomarina sp.]MCH8500636.1 uroporphyrinogen-III synthase [Aliidiomarina sp.]